MARVIQLCRYYALCDRPAVGYVDNPIIGRVPTCQRCADKHDIKLVPLTDAGDDDE